MNQLLRLLEVADSWPDPPSVYLTTSFSLVEKLRRRGKVYDLGDCNRHQPLRMLGVLARSVRFAIKERPHVVISTGSLPIAIACICCKVVGAKVVWVDSIANISQLSLSGSMMRHVADLFLTQWPELAAKYADVEYVGELV